MTPTLSHLLADIAALFRRETDLIVRVASVFVFLPALAVQLLADPLPALPREPGSGGVPTAWIEAVAAWGRANAGWYVLADGIALYGTAALAVLLLDPARPDVRGALAGAGRRLPRFILASLLVALPVGAGMWLFVLPGLWLQARLIATIPALAAEQPMAASGALVRSWGMTRGAGWPLTAAVATLFLLQWLAMSPLAPVDAWLRAPEHENPFLIALVGIALAAVAAAWRVALLLLGIAVYRRRAMIGT